MTLSQDHDVWPVGEPLKENVLQRAKSLPIKPASLSLEGELVRIEPLNLEKDLENLHLISNGYPICLRPGLEHPAYDPDIHVWRYLAHGPFSSAGDLGEVLQRQVDTSNGLPLVIRDKISGHPVGVVNIMSNFPEHLKVELGNIWYSPAVQGHGFNTEACYLLLCYLFDIGYRRIEWKCDSLNRRSRKAAEYLGFRFEMVQDGHCIYKGRNRDTAWFRILEPEWQSSLKPQLEQRIAAAKARSMQ